ncbi:uncharacterized protein BP5553_07982 [Venustampulla echinocandica]|uniref:Uncharacterized protein n=1 Tax=Venustampulla echinocandica TaxID=2656787 RepID=A0A370TFE2_9HELO|nr:uncharacterized protein BP5553_07982 [Venustampulla echinocandica]RDL33614.1 hypothetical protein BP5553_07982 [Venustampulla echinocandica]
MQAGGGERCRVEWETWVRVSVSVSVMERGGEQRRDLSEWMQSASASRTTPDTNHHDPEPSSGGSGNENENESEAVRYRRLRVLRRVCQPPPPPSSPPPMPPNAPTLPALWPTPLESWVLGPGATGNTREYQGIPELPELPQLAHTRTESPFSGGRTDGEFHVLIGGGDQSIVWRLPPGQSESALSRKESHPPQSHSRRHRHHIISSSSLLSPSSRSNRAQCSAEYHYGLTYEAGRSTAGHVHQFSPPPSNVSMHHTAPGPAPPLFLLLLYTDADTDPDADADADADADGSPRWKTQTLLNSRSTVLGSLLMYLQSLSAQLQYKPCCMLPS